MEAQVLDAAVLDADVHAQLVAAQRVVLESLQVVRIQLAEVVRALVVLEDVVAVEVVHQSPKTSRPACSASTSASMSAASLYTPTDARAVAPTPRQRISGCAQWWPARMHTPPRSASSATSWGCIPSIVNDARPPLCSASGGPTMRSPGTSERRSSMYAVSARSWARTRSMPSPER